MDFSKIITGIRFVYQSKIPGLWQINYAENEGGALMEMALKYLVDLSGIFKLIKR